MPKHNSVLKSFGLAALLAAVGFSQCFEARAASPDDPSDRGVFTLRLAGKQIGTETFEIRAKKGAVEASAKIALRVEQDGKAAEYKTTPRLVLSPELRPLSYKWSQKGPQSSDLEVDLKSPPVKAKYRTVRGEQDVREFQLPPDIVILDNNVIHHYQIAVIRFRRAGGGNQTFRAFIPQEALPGSLQIEEAGPDQVDVGGREQMLKRLIVTTDNARIELWIDKDDRLQKLAIPAAQLEVLRKK